MSGAGLCACVCSALSLLFFIVVDDVDVAVTIVLFYSFAVGKPNQSTAAHK